MTTRFSDELGDGILRMTIGQNKLPIPVRFLDRVEIFALNIFDERNLCRRGVVEFPDQSRNLVETRLLRGSPASLARDDLESVPLGTHEDRLEHTALRDRLSQLRNRGVVKALSGLSGIGLNAADFKFAHS